MAAVHINYLAVIVCALASMIIGSLWYGPLFGKAWMKEVGKTKEELTADFNPMKTYGQALIGSFFTILILAYLISLTGALEIIDGIRIALATWFGFTLATGYVTALFEGSSKKLLLINAFYNLAVLLVSAIIIILW